MVILKNFSWSETGNRVDMEVQVARFLLPSYEFKTHVVGQGLNEHKETVLAEQMVEMINEEQYKVSKRGTYVFPMRQQFNATGYIYAKNFPTDDSE